MEKHILILGGFSEIHKRLKKLGVQISIFNDTKSIKPYYSEIYDRVIAVPTIESEEAFVEFAKVLHKIKPIDYITTFHENFRETAVQIAKELDVNYAYQLETIKLVNNKFFLREKLRELGIDNTKSAIVNSFEELRRFIERVNGTIILKPLNSSGSTGIWKIEGVYDELEKDFLKYKKAFSQFQICAEEFIYGNEYSVEAFTENNEHKIYCITQKYKNEENFVEVGHTVPSVLSESQEQGIKNFVTSILDAIQLTNGPSHTEIILTSDGPKVVETHIRLGGDMLTKLYEIVSEGIDILEMTARNAVGESVIDKIRDISNYNHYASIWYKEGLPGKIEKINTEIDIETDKNIKEISILVREGDIMKNLNSSVGRMAYVIATGDSDESSVSRAKKAIEKISISMM
ncbi:ATP-grasp domain-containing protein [Bacillus sp. DX4.1]|uniref:ATP-grasp domain-containing protein n=1 Tax=Bacillus sp. DX4.1 TaxID=3055867 RepID=UPI0025A00BF2|nr:ATP-grasp domain-containing protein [Bacillus sp. DX4.1]MDM5185981.1 ATP-grasp domain-containing protein [Bacillus sp. DX4.1]